MTEKEKVFNKIATEEAQRQGDNIGNFEYYSYYLCPDQYVGLIKDFKEDDKKTKDDFPVRYNIGVVENILILILESPHRDEFYAEAVKDENGTVIHHKGDPIGPANGPTGRNIRKHIAEIFPNFSNYHLILMNAIPFQCSLGLDLNNNKPNQKTRDEVFKAAWDNDAIGKEFFEGRLRVLLDKLPKNSKNVVIVNACTKDNDDKKQSGRKTNVTNVIKELIKTKTAVKEVWETPHPSSGCWCAHKYCEKIYPEN